jgi:glycosyltransferase involved in cell wall biosynthesis
VQVVLCAAAPDTPEIAQRLRAAVAAQPRVTWIDAMVPAADVIQLYSHAALFVCPSVYEPFGVINLEAMACETPVVASAVGGILEVVVDGETGILVPPARPDALGEAMAALLSHPTRARAMGQAGRRHVERRFGWDAVAERTEAVYRDAAAAFGERGHRA